MQIVNPHLCEDQNVDPKHIQLRPGSLTCKPSYVEPSGAVSALREVVEKERELDEEISAKRKSLNAARESAVALQDRLETMRSESNDLERKIAKAESALGAARTRLEAIFPEAEVVWDSERGITDHGLEFYRLKFLVDLLEQCLDRWRKRFEELSREINSFCKKHDVKT